MTFYRRSSLREKITLIEATALRAIHTTPVAVSHIPAANEVLVPDYFFAQYKYGTVLFANVAGDATLQGFNIYANASFPLSTDSLVTQTQDLVVYNFDTMSIYNAWTWAGDVNTHGSGVMSTADMKGLPLLLRGLVDFQAGEIATATINAAGTGYLVGDTGTVVLTGSDAATYRITSIGAAGAVTGFTIVDKGNRYSVATGLATTTSGIGTGFKVNVTSINKGDGSLIVTLGYRAFTLQ